jgi:DNA-binding transcriptional ArsR family regulator
MIPRPALSESEEPSWRVADASQVDAADLGARFFRVLGDPTRLRLLSLLLDAPTGEYSVGELVTALEAPQSRISTHLGCLRWCGLVQTRREGKQVYYRVADSRIRDLWCARLTLLDRTGVGVSLVRRSYQVIWMHWNQERKERHDD